MVLPAQGEKLEKFALLLKTIILLNNNTHFSQQLFFLFAF